MLIRNMSSGLPDFGAAVVLVALRKALHRTASVVGAVGVADHARKYHDKTRRSANCDLDSRSIDANELVLVFLFKNAIVKNSQTSAKVLFLHQHPVRVA